MSWLVLNLLSSYVKPSSKLAQKLRGLIWLKLASRTYSLNIEAPKLIANISAVAQPQLARHAPRVAIPFGRGKRQRLARFQIEEQRLAHGSRGVAEKGRHARPTRAPHSKPESTSGRPSGDMS